MITKSIGLMRNVIKQRKQLKQLINHLVMGDNVILITESDGTMFVGGHTETDATTLFMLGRAVGQAIEAAHTVDSNIDVSNYLMQPNIVATTYLEKRGVFV